ncbi:MAG TPA: acetyl-CoA carboxylase biotin carboxyl carrier protein [Myxococcota bacterium]|nr:acetyl-CoA carboxylase biotin carboxyl carrier protein [Myxococcota bacterium]
MEPKEVENLVRAMRRLKVAEFTYKVEGVELSVRFEGEAVAAPVYVAAPAPVAAPVSAAPAPVASAPAAAAPKDYRAVRAPIVGTFYRAASPDAPPYVKVGDRVRKGQVVCIIEAMKLMNQIEADVEGVVAEIAIENGQPVQFGQDLFRITAG